MSKIGTKYPPEKLEYWRQYRRDNAEKCGTKDVSGGNRIATVFASVRGDLTTANFCMRVMMMSPVFKPSFHI
jgi:hypothetical protein